MTSNIWTVVHIFLVMLSFKRFLQKLLLMIIISKKRPLVMENHGKWLDPLVSVLCCVSCVPASCVHIWFVSCPCQMWLLVNLCPAVFVSLSMIYLCIYSPVCSVRFRLVYSLLPVFPVCQPCLVLIKDYYLSLRPRLRVLVPPCCVHRDTLLAVWWFLSPPLLVCH